MDVTYKFLTAEEFHSPEYVKLQNKIHGKNGHASRLKRMEHYAAMGDLRVIVAIIDGKWWDKLLHIESRLSLREKNNHSIGVAILSCCPNRGGMVWENTCKTNSIRCAPIFHLHGILRLMGLSKENAEDQI